MDEHDNLSDLTDNDVVDDNADRRIAEIDKPLNEISAQKEIYLPDDMARSGVVIFINRFGKPEIALGIVRTEDEIEDAEENEGDEAIEDGKPGGAVVNARGGTTEVEDSTPKFAHSQSLIEVAALRVELANNPEVALAAVVHAMLLRISYSGYVSEQSVLQLSLTHEHMGKWVKHPEDCKASAAFESLQENYGHKIPGNPADLFDWCLEQSRDELLSLPATPSMRWRSNSPTGGMVSHKQTSLAVLSKST
ncbi:hypothetical protein [Rhizobium sp. BR 362]|uniref:hypothetical protein n=1 Tax=Rhizobium sp. BR 362 TaxID=3040670 RepID=UPI002F411098